MTNNPLRMFRKKILEQSKVIDEVLRNRRIEVVKGVLNITVPAHSTAAAALILDSSLTVLRRSADLAGIRVKIVLEV